jgi:hypothetical protein
MDICNFDKVRRLARNRNFLLAVGTLKMLGVSLFSAGILAPKLIPKIRLTEFAVLLPFEL